MGKLSKCLESRGMVFVIVPVAAVSMIVMTPCLIVAAPLICAGFWLEGELRKKRKSRKESPIDM